MLLPWAALPSVFVCLDEKFKYSAFFENAERFHILILLKLFRLSPTARLPASHGSDGAIGSRSLNHPVNLDGKPSHTPRNLFKSSLVPRSSLKSKLLRSFGLFTQRGLRPLQPPQAPPQEAPPEVAPLCSAPCPLASLAGSALKNP